MARVTGSFDGTVETTTLFAPSISTGAGETNGIPIFVNAETDEPYDNDIWNLKRQGRVGSTTTGTIGKKGHGKTTVNQVISYRLGIRPAADRRMRVMGDDIRMNNGKPEYQKFCKASGVTEAALRNYQLNLLDSQLGMTYSQQLASIKPKFEFSSGRRFDLAESE